MVSTLVSIPGYRISEELYNGSRTLVYRGYRETDSLPVVIKLLKNPYPSFSELLSFRNQYTIAKNLNSPLIIQTYSLEPYQNGYALVMEDFGGISLKEWGVRGTRQSLMEFLEIAIALCNILDVLYRERIIHKDIKSANILINPETKQVKLIDFSIASLLPRETQTLINLNVLEGTLAYISPEQTGRMNRGIDYRTDFYSLGVTFYESLTGELPFKSNDPMELVHCHIAKLPPNMNKLHPHKALSPYQGEGWGEVDFPIPQVLCDIVMKLMGKNAEDRYQNVLGLKFDLENCLSQLQETGKIKGFEIGQQDVCDRFIIPDKLYGRETEVSTLFQAFERVSLGATEMMLVAGFSGIGKTAIVNEVHKPIVRQRGYFIKGKYDQFQRNIPFSAFVQAFRDLMAQLLSESDAQIQQWKNQILEAVGENGQVIIEVIPELEIIIGKQSPAIELSGNAAQNRFNLLFQKFTQVFTSLEHPLVMFLDDLQWADSASLKLMQLLMADTGHLLLIGAYRDNEVNPGHPLMLTLSEMQKTLFTINTITLAPLSQVTVNQLVADTLKSTETLASPLSQLVYQKTQGNPFFTTQFLKALYQEHLIQFDFELACWQCDIVQVTTQAITDNVVAFMAFQLRRLPESTQHILQLAACIGNQFDLATLAIVSEQSEIETAADLWKALQEGLILPQGDVYKFYVGQETLARTPENIETVTYKFLHDRVQQAAYSLIPEEQKQFTHYLIGNLLLENLSQADQEQQLFEIVGHLNIGSSFIVDPSKREELAQLNLTAGNKARNSTAYEAASNYFATGIDLLATDFWKKQYQLSLELFLQRAETETISGHFESASHLIETILDQTDNLLDRCAAYELKMRMNIVCGEPQIAIDVALLAINLLGIKLEYEPLTSVDFDQLLNLPKMSDPAKLKGMEILVSVCPAAYTNQPELMLPVTLTMLKLCNQHGNSPIAAFAYGLYGVLLCGFMDNIELGYQFGQLSLKILEKYNAHFLKSKVYQLFYAHVCGWKEPVSATIDGLLESVQSGLDTGDVEYALYGLKYYCIYYFLTGAFLDDVDEIHKKYKNLSRNIEHVHNEIAIWQQIGLNLKDFSDGDVLISLANLNEEDTFQYLKEKQQNIVLFAAYFAKCQLYYFKGDYAKAIENANKANTYIAFVTGKIYTTVHNFYFSLALLGLAQTLEPAQRSVYLNQVEENQNQLQAWANHAPMNILHKFHLVKAEICRVLGDYKETIEHYDRAIALAKEHGYIQEEALANELAAKFYLNWGKQRIAQEYMTEAYYGYARWGAKTKVADLERRYPQLLAPILQKTYSPLSTTETIFTLGTLTSTSSATSSSSSVSVALDLAAILKASQTISSEIELEKLLSSLLSIVIENAGADKCVLMLLRDEHLLIKGSIIEGSEPVVLQRLLVEDSQDIPLKLIYKVKHNKQTVVLLDASADPTLANDPYIIRQQPKSILCSPILHQGKLLGILYLENNLATGAFTSDRVELLNLLCTQAAISLENARLFEQSLEYAQQLERSLDELNTTQSRFYNLVDNVPGVVYQFHIAADGTMVMLYISADCYNLFEITAEQAMANVQLLIERIHSEDAAHHQQLIAESVQTLNPWCWEGRIVTLSGIIKWIHGEARILQQNDGSVVWDGLLLDISDRKRAEEELQNAQLQMVQSEKMSALGNLIAGVAHEMNNPLGFIAASLKLAKPTIADLVEHLGLYQSSLPNKSEEIIEHAEEIDLDYSLEDLPKMIDSMSMACDRLKNISTSLRTFSRADQDYKVPFNIHQGIDSTILILKHRLKANEQRLAIEVVTNYGNLPEVECFPGQLNQVFMNLLANAIDALEESNQWRSFEEIKANYNCIKITTSVENNLVKIAIDDNGKGMNEQVKEKIFDHLFTTKAVGKGTGLGLAIARQIIVEKHGGAIEVNSQLGEGTEFAIRLPLSA
ncbi:trifunctional serine/threonine-protein kinase/ATP-binding protein/sensor histidine kinase [Nostoc sp.]|uniref:trifunctional serine/threonine-protein kinase/ATP-binding protein/sensor histidine kinase n=1 Tax=Nostoc sp. TaxID=1180 RepID=UPI002FF4A5FA